MAIKRNWKYYLTRLDYVKFLWIHVTVWITAIILALLVQPFYNTVGPLVANVYTQYINPQPNIVNPKTIAAEPYEIGRTNVIDLVNGQKIMFVSINNKPNPTVGFFPWVYTYQVLSSDGEVLEQRTRGSEFLLPGEQTYIVVYSRNPLASELRIQPNDVDSVLVPHNPDSPNFLQPPDIEQRQATLTENESGQSYRVYLLYKNNDRLDVNRLDFIYLLRDRSGQIVGINSSFLTGFKAGSQREALVLDQPIPVDEPERIPLLESITRVNYLDPSITKLD